MSSELNTVRYKSEMSCDVSSRCALCRSIASIMATRATRCLFGPMFSSPNRSLQLDTKMHSYCQHSVHYQFVCDVCVKFYLSHACSTNKRKTETGKGRVLIELTSKLVLGETELAYSLGRSPSPLSWTLACSHM